jgi:hypothetical protein
MNRILKIFLAFAPLYITALEIGHMGEQWAICKYTPGSDSEHIGCFDRWIDGTEAKTEEETLWLFMGRASRASFVGGLNAASEIASFLPDLSQKVQNPKTELEAMVCAMTGYLYGKLPGWPLSIGSNSRAEELLLSAESFSFSEDVSFYLAHGYFVLGESDKASSFLDRSDLGYKKRKATLYTQGKIEELQHLRDDLNKKR